MWQWVRERVSSVRRWLMTSTPEKAKPQLPRTNGRDYSGMEYLFENLVLKGGGAKGIAYIGAAKVLDEAGILDNITRFAGTSAGAITAALLAIGMKPEQLLEELSQKNLMELLDPPVTKRWFSFLRWFPHIPVVVPNWLTVDNISMALTVVTEGGACEGDEFLTWFGGILDRHLARLYPLKGGLDKDITFDKLYHVLGKELCIVAYNMDLGNETYFHVKTEPMMKIKDAVRMSMSIPVVFKPFEQGASKEQKPRSVPRMSYTFIDGGLAANYPLWAFDGWYLSMKKEDTFHEKLTVEEGQMVRRMFHPEYRKERFDTRNDKTLGILLFSSSDREMYQEQFEEREKKLEKMKPEFRKKREDTELYKKYREETNERMKAQTVSIESLKKLVGKDVRTMIEKIEGKHVPPQPNFPPDKPAAAAAGFKPFAAGDLPPPRPVRQTMMSTEGARKLFYKTFSDDYIAILDAPSKEKAFDQLMIDEAGKLTTDRLWKIYDNFGPLQLARRTYLGLRLVSTPRQYFSTMLEFVGSNSGISEGDVNRSVAIDVDYVGTMDFDMASEDMEFLMRQGAAATIAFLEEKKGGLELRLE